MRKQIKETFDLIEKNPTAKSELRKALVQFRDQRAEDGGDQGNSYQDKVIKRLRDKRLNEEKMQTASMKYVASMMGNARDMHRFLQMQQKDPLFEDRTAYKLVSGIRTQKDSERLHFILTTKEISTGKISEIF